MPELETSQCVYCPNLCRHVCPVGTVEARETYTPRSKMVSLRRLRQADLKPTTESTASLYACTGCGACQDACLHDVSPRTALFSGRAESVRAGIVHPKLDALLERVLSRARSAAITMRQGIDPRRIPAEAQVALMPACNDPGGGRTTLQLLDRLGADYVGLADLSAACGGYPLLAGGRLAEFRDYASTVARSLQGYSRIVVACPACAHTMRTEYPQRGIELRPEVIHLAEFLGRFADQIGSLVKEKLPAAHYHDPCYLGRHSGVYDPPRHLLSKVLLEVHELSRNRADADCSGGGGLLPVTMPDTAAAIAEQRVAEVRESAGRVVTACPTCRLQLDREGVTSLDLVEVLEQATR